MNLMFSRKETENEIEITQKPYFYYVFATAFISSILNKYYPDIGILIAISSLAWLTFMLLFLVSFKNIFVTRREISERMKNGEVRVSGSRFSFKSPVTYTFTKLLKN